MSTETTLPLDEVSSATKGVLVVAGVSVILLVTVLGVIISRCVSKVLEFLPKSSSKGKSGAKGKARSSGGGAAPQPNPAEGAERARGPDLKSLIKEQQKASSKKTAVKDDQASHHPLFLNTLKGHGDVVHSVAWNAAGTHLLSACEDMYVRLWDLIDVTSKEPKFKRIKTAKLPLGAAWGDGPDAVMVLMKGVPDAQVAGYAPATSKEAGGTYEQQWLVSNVHGKEAPLAMASACGSTAAARRSLAISCSARKEARIYNAQGREVGLCEPNSLINHDVTMSPDGRFVAVAGFTAEVKIWEIKWAKDTGDCKGAFKALELKGHKSQVQCVAFSPDSQRVVTASKDGTLRVWNINVRYAQEEDPKTLLVIPQPLATGRLYQHLAYGPTGVIAASWEGQVHLLSAANGEMLDSIDAHESSITGMQWCPRLVKTPGAAAPHAVLATSSRDRRVRLWKSPQ